MSNMPSHQVRSFSELHDVLLRYRDDRRWLFRGHRNPDWKLQPKAGRSRFMLNNSEIVFDAWRRRAVEYIAQVPITDWEWLAVAQHHGLPTPLLDWSKVPLVACFFATLGTTSGAATVYAFHPKRWASPADMRKSPFKLQETLAFMPHAFSPRISRQSGVFTLHTPIEKVVANDGSDGAIERIDIASEYVPALRRDLDHYGYNHSSLFPGLDGLAEYLSWIATEKDLSESLIEQEEFERKMPPMPPGGAPCG